MASGKKIEKLSARDRVKKRIRKKLSGTAERPRLCVYRTSHNMYVQAIDDVTGTTLAGASTKDKEVLESLAKMEVKEGVSRSTKSLAGAEACGIAVAERMKAKGFSAVVFDRNGFIYHGRIAAVADGARKGGLNF